MKWPEEITDRGFSNLVGSGRMLSVNKAEPSHREELCQVMEFRNFLNDFTLSSERSASEVAVWKHYLVFAQLFGIADKVSEQFSKLYPEMFGRVAEECGVDPVFLLYYISWNNRMSANYYKSAVSTAQGKSVHGYGRRHLLWRRRRIQRRRIRRGYALAAPEFAHHRLGDCK